MGALPPVFIEFLGKKTGFSATAAGVRSELRQVEREGGGSMARLGGVSKAALLGIGVAAVVAAAKTVHMAADFQTQMTRVRTGAGELQKNMSMVSAGVLHMAGEVGQSTEELTSGLYMVESAGFHGAAALNVLKVSAEGAKVGAADMASVTDATTTALNAYKLGAGDVTHVMNALVATEANGKTNMEALASSMSSILPVAASAHVGLNEVLGAMATMTAQGTSAKVAATYLRQTIGQLSNPTAKAADEMKSLGLKSIDVSKSLGKNGLAATLNMLTEAIQKHMGPGGDVLIEKLKSASKNTTSFQKVLANLSPTQQTYIGALATMVGGTKSMMAALQLSGPHLETFKKNVASINEHVKAGGKNVEGWADVQATFNQRMAEAKGSVQAIGIEIGTALLPYAMKMIGVFSQSVTWLTKHKLAVELAGAAIGGILVVGLAAATIAAWNFTAAILANPLTWVVVGIMALAAGLVYLITHWKQVWGWIQTNTPGVAHAFVSTWKTSLALFRQAWQATSKAIQTVVKWINDNVLSWLKARGKEFAAWWHQNSDSLSRVWKMYWDFIVANAKNAWAVIKMTLGILMSSWKTVWGIVRDTAKLAWAAISSTVTLAIHTVLNVVSLVLDLITGKWSRVWGDLKHLVGQGLNDVVNVITSIASGFGTLLWNAGVNLIQGFVNGIESMGGVAKNAVSNIAHGAVHGFEHVLGIHSPSRVFQQLGIYVVQGLVNGLTGSTSSVKSATNRITTLLLEARNKVAALLDGKGKKSASLVKWVHDHEKSLDTLTKNVRREDAQLTRLAAQRDNVATRLKAAQANLSSLQKAWTQERDSIASGILQGTSVVTDSPDGFLSGGDVVQHMQDQVQAALKFAQDLQTLRARGLNSDMIQQLAAAGYDQGGATASALATASGSQLNQLNQMEKTLKGAATKTGSAVADSMYAAGIQSAKGLIKGLQSQEKSIETLMVKIAKSMETAIRKALGIHSPSRVFHAIGRFITSGLSMGIMSNASEAVSATNSLVGAVTGAGATKVRLPGSAGGGDVHHHVHVHVDVQGSVLAERDLTSTIQKVMGQNASRNSATWANYRR